ncbi:MAG: hypothetical protein ACH255_21030 [Candidatus Thiodiazotropha sp.]
MRATAEQKTTRLSTKRAAAKPKTTHLPTKVTMGADVPWYVLVLARKQHHPTSKSPELCSPSSMQGSTTPDRTSWPREESRMGPSPGPVRSRF